MRIDWRVLTGPVLVIAAVAVLVGVDHGLLRMPNPSTILLFAVAVGAYFAGLRGGMLGAAVAIFFAVLDFVLPGTFLHHGNNEVAHLVVLAVGAPTIAVMIGAMRHKVMRSQAREQERNAENKTLRTALDRVEYGVVLLDSEMRAQFINRAFRRVWKLPDEKADAKPAFVALMYHGRDTAAYATPREEMNRYVAERVQHVRAGDSTPLDIRLASGDVVRFQCTGLPDGGRMLAYVSVTDLFRHAEALETLATVDGLTGVYNRRHFLELADAEWARCERYHRPLSLIVLDIDHFKSINDCFGHDAGDAVLMDFAQLCRDRKRKTDVVGRIGGEEFAILLPETELAEALVVADRLRQKTEQRSLTVATEALSLTVSLGVAQAGVGMSGFPRLLKVADEALYQAKQKGRNQVIAAPAPALDGTHKVAAA